MSVTMSGAEWNAFYHDPKFWPEGVWHEEEEIEVDGEYPENFEDLPINAKIVLRCGLVFGTLNNNETRDLIGYFRKWRRLQNTVFITCEMSREKEAEVLAAITAAGGRIIK